MYFEWMRERSHEQDYTMLSTKERLDLQRSNGLNWALVDRQYNVFLQQRATHHPRCKACPTYTYHNNVYDDIYDDVYDDVYQYSDNSDGEALIIDEAGHILGA